MLPLFTREGRRPAESGRRGRDGGVSVVTARVVSLSHLAAPHEPDFSLERAYRDLVAMVEQSVDMLSRHDEQGVFTYVSSACTAIYGRESEELIGRHPLEFAHPDDVDVATASIRAALAQGREFEVEHRVIHPDGEWVWVHARVRTYIDESGRMTSVGVTRDISGQRIAEEALAEAERQARELIDLSGDVHSCTDPHGRLLYISPNCRRVLGYLPEELVGECPHDYTHPEDRARYAATTHEAREHGAAEIEYRFQRPDGTYMWLHVLLRTRYDPRGRPLEIVRTGRDITAQHAAEEALTEAERQARIVLELSGDLHTRTNAAGVFVYASPNSAQVIGWRPEELLGRRPGEFAHPDDLVRCDAAVRSATERGAAEIEYRIRRPDGSYLWIHVLLRAHYDEHGDLIELVRAARDISAQRAAEEALREATERFEGAFEHAPIGMALVALDGRWLKVNRELCRITGYPEAELLQKSFRDVSHPDDLTMSVEGLRSLQGGDRFQAEKRYLHAGGRVIWVHVAVSVVRDAHGRPQHFVTQTQDITERKEFQDRLSYLADHDPLTELFNRRRFESELERQVSRSRRYHESAAVVLLDLDHFKYLNDALGHHVGDGVIAHAGRVLAARLRSSDVLARSGGDEYAVILPRVDAVQARHVAGDLIEAIERSPFEHDGHRYVLSASAGVVLLDRHTVSAEDAMVNVDLAIHEAKQHGRNRMAVYSPDTRENILLGLTWSQRLKDALATDAFMLHAQPIVELRTGETVMRELLIRMCAPDGELVPPGHFLRAAARFGYMPAIDRWVIRQAARFAAEVPGRCLAVNLAANTIAEPGLLEYITDALDAVGADPADLIFEVSESDVIANLDDARSVCERLRSLGARIALDDFGSGFSGFSYLKAIDIDLLKIDGQFVRELHSNRLDRLVVEAIQHVADGIGVPTVAEYVVSDAVAERLRELGATYGQGFHLGKPAPLS